MFKTINEVIRAGFEMIDDLPIETSLVKGISIVFLVPYMLIGAAFGYIFAALDDLLLRFKRD